VASFANADLLHKHGAKTDSWIRAEESILIAARAGHIEAVKKHLTDGADLNEEDNIGQTPLHIACYI